MSPNAPTPPAALALLDTVAAARGWLTAAETLASRGRLGPWQSPRGVEGALLAAASAAQAEDWIVADHHGSILLPTRGLPLDLWFADLLGAGTGPNRGRSAPSEIGNRSLRILGGTSLLGTQIAQAAGIAHAAKVKGRREAVLAFTGAGGAATGDFHVGLNFAGVFGSPLVLVLLRSARPGWDQERLAGDDVVARAAAFGFPGVSVDGADLCAVAEAVGSALDRARGGGGATLIEVMAAPAEVAFERLITSASSASFDGRTHARDVEGRAHSHAREAAGKVADDPPISSLFDDVYAAPDARLRAQAAGLAQHRDRFPDGRDLFLVEP